jgi:hypothetical protein
MLRLSLSRNFREEICDKKYRENILPFVHGASLTTTTHKNAQPLEPNNT